MTDRLVRKLAAILYADVAGYSRLTGEDEDGTHRALRTYLGLISDRIQEHSGRVVHYAGDAVLADFGTVVDAVTCAVATQGELSERNADVPDDRKVRFRIGVNLGDVIVEPRLPHHLGQHTNLFRPRHSRAQGSDRAFLPTGDAVRDTGPRPAQRHRVHQRVRHRGGRLLALAIQEQVLNFRLYPGFATS